MKHLVTTTMLLLFTTAFFKAKAQTISEADSKAITKVYQELMMAFGRFDAATVAGFYSENGTHIAPDGQIVTGRTVIKDYYEKLFTWIRTQPKPDKTDFEQTGWVSRYLSNDIILVTYNDGQTRHFGNKTETELIAMSVVLKRTRDGWLCDQVTMTPVRPMQ